MAKEVQTQQTGRNAFQQFKDETRQTNIEGDLLRFTKAGEWIAGQDEEEIDEGRELIMGLNTMRRGWQKWWDQAPVESRFGLVTEGYRPEPRSELGDMDEEEWEEDTEGNKRDPWQETTMVLLLDPKTKDVFTFSTSSKSGKTALGEVSGVYGDRLQDGEDAEEMPVVRLMRSSYKHKTYGKIYIPVFELTGKWVKPPTPKEDKPVKKVVVKKAEKATASAKPPKALPAPHGQQSKSPRNGARI